MQKKKTSAPGKKVVPLSRTHKKPENKAPMALAALLMIVALVAGFVLQYKVFPNGWFNAGETAKDAVTEVAPTTSIRINEVMSSNGSAWSDENGNFSDYVELYNTSATEAVDLRGWILADAAEALNVFTFPECELGPGEYLLIYCDGNLRNTPGYAFHAPFKLSSDGDSLVLYNAQQKAVESLNIPALDRNQVYACRDGGWQITGAYTPAMPNEDEYHNAMVEFLTGDVASQVVISEIMADNATYIPDEEGMYCDYVELHNTTSSPISLNGWCLSDDASKTMKWRFPDVTIPADGYMVVYCSGKDRKTPGANLHTNFKLNAEGETVILTNENGIVQNSVTYSNLKTDRSWSLYDGSYSGALSPTPGKANTTQSAAAIEKEFAAANSYKVYINEVSAGTSRTTDVEGEQPEWIELYNGSMNDVDLSGWGLSDESDQPRKWQFPSGTVISAGSYKVIKLKTGDASSPTFGLSFLPDVDETVTLCTPDGTVVDRMPLPRLYASVSYGRMSGQNGFFYLAKMTPGAQNTSTGYAMRTQEAEYSVAGGMFDEPLTVTLTAQPNATIRYSTDGSVPTSDSPVYTGPIEITETTVLRTRVWRDNEYPSVCGTQTYFMGVNHTVNVISLVMDPEDLWSDSKGIYVKGPHATSSFPYGSINSGANFWMVWEKSGNVEYFSRTGETILSQGCGIRLHGQYSRAEAQKAFKVIARSEYDEQNLFNAPLFSKRDYTWYQSFILRASGEDLNKTRFRDALLTGLAANTSVMYQETEIVVVYLNGAYWGQYNMRERINQSSIAQFEGWTEKDNIDLVKANSNVMKGSNDSYASMLEWVKKNGVKNDEALARVAKTIDIDNYIEYMCLEIFTGNTDTLNVKRYRNAVEGDGRWRWILFDLDWAFYTDTNSIARWIKPGGMGNGNRTDNTLFIALMKNSTFRDRFLTRFGEMMANEFTTQNIVNEVNRYINLLTPEMKMTIERWGKEEKDLSASNWKNEIQRFVSYAESRPTKILNYTKKALKLSDSDMKKYFSGAMDAIAAYKKK